MSNNVVTRKFQKDVLREIVWGDVGETFDGLTVVEQGDWINKGKYDVKEVIFECDGMYYSITIRRTGSYYGYYTYDDEWWDDEVECIQLEKVPVTKYEWRPVKVS